MTLKRKFQTPSSLSFRIPNCFLLIGGIIAVLSVLGLLLVKEPERGGEKTEQKQLLDDSELPSLDAKEVLRTALFYKVALFSQTIEDNQPFPSFRSGSLSSQFVEQWYVFN